MHNRKLYLDARFFISVYSGSKRSPSLFDITGIRFLPRNFRKSSLFTAAVKTLRQLDAFRLLTIRAKTSTSWENLLLLSDKFCANLCHFYIDFFSDFKAFALVFLLYYFVPAMFLFYLLSVLFCVFVLFCVVFVSLWWLDSSNFSC